MKKKIIVEVDDGSGVDWGVIFKAIFWIIYWITLWCPILMYKLFKIYQDKTYIEKEELNNKNWKLFLIICKKITIYIWWLVIPSVIWIILYSFLGPDEMFGTTLIEKLSLKTTENIALSIYWIFISMDIIWFIAFITSLIVYRKYVPKNLMN